MKSAVPRDKGISGLAASDRPGEDIPTAAEAVIRADAEQKDGLCGYAVMHTFTHSGQQLSAAICTPHMPCLFECTVLLQSFRGIPRLNATDEQAFCRCAESS